MYCSGLGFALLCFTAVLFKSISGYSRCPFSGPDLYHCNCSFISDVQRVSCKFQGPLRFEEREIFRPRIDLEVRRSRHDRLPANALNGIDRRFIIFRSNPYFHTIDTAAFSTSTAYAIAFNDNRRLHKIYNNAFVGWKAPERHPSCQAENKQSLECQMSLSFMDNGPLYFSMFTFMSLDNLTALYLASSHVPIRLKRHPFTLLTSLRQVELSGKVYGLKRGVFLRWDLERKLSRPMDGLRRVVIRKNMKYAPRASHFQGLPDLRHLSFLRVNLRHPDDDVLIEVPDLEYLDMAECDMTRLPTSVGHLKNLKVLNLNGNHFHHLPPQLKPLPSVTKVALLLQKHRFKCTCDIRWISSWAPFRQKSIDLFSISHRQFTLGKELANVSSWSFTEDFLLETALETAAPEFETISFWSKQNNPRGEGSLLDCLDLVNVICPDKSVKTAPKIHPNEMLPVVISAALIWLAA